MGFNYALEKKKFDAKWEQLRKSYQNAGMTESAITEMYEFDWNAFLSERRYQMHTQALPSESITEGDEEAKSSLIRMFDSLKVQFNEDNLSGRFGWVDTLEDGELSRKVKALPQSELELLTLLVADGYQQVEIALLRNTTRQNINNKLARIKKSLK